MMSDDEESYEVVFIWKIENVNEKFPWERICSPVFLSNLMDSTHWKLETQLFYGSKWISFHFNLECTSNSIRPKKIDCEVSFLDVDGSPIQKTEKDNLYFSNSSRHFLGSLYVENDVFELNKSKFLPRDTLTVRCRMRRSGFRGQRQIQPEVHSSRTRLERGCFNWTIEDICNFQADQTSKLHLVKNQSKVPVVTFELFWDESENLQVRLFVTECYRQICSSWFKISLLDANGEVFLKKDLHLSFDIVLLTKLELMENKNVYLPMGILSLQVECFLLFEIINNNDEDLQPFSYQDLHIVRETGKVPIIAETNPFVLSFASLLSNRVADEKCNSNSHREFFQNMQRLFKEGFFSDLYILVGDCIFQSHKCVLSARSPVLKDMLQELEDCLNIPDVDSDTMSRMLQFMYSDKLEEDLQWYDAMLLFFAAKRYAITDLKKATFSVLKTNICALNACEILAHADLYKDEELKSTAMDFVVSHGGEIVGNEKWNEFQKSNAQLAAEILCELNKRKKSND